MPLYQCSFHTGRKCTLMDVCVGLLTKMSIESFNADAFLFRVFNGGTRKIGFLFLF